MTFLEIGSLFKNARNNRNLTQKEVAEKLGYTSQNISLWEFGKACPKIETVLDFCEIMNYDPPFFCRGILSDSSQKFKYNNDKAIELIEVELSKQNLTKKLMEYKLEISRPTLNKLLKGEISPSYFQFLQLVEILNIKPEFLLIPIKK
mgnify:FL=1